MLWVILLVLMIMIAIAPAIVMLVEHSYTVQADGNEQSHETSREMAW